MEGLYLTTDKKKKSLEKKVIDFFFFCKQEKYLQTGNKKKQCSLSVFESS